LKNAVSTSIMHCPRSALSGRHQIHSCCQKVAGHACTVVTKVESQWPLPLYKLTTLKANGNRVIVVHKEIV
jgi:hypothetical protein